MKRELLKEYYRLAIGEEIGKLGTIRRAISAWRAGAEKELADFAKHYEDRHGALPEEIADELGHEFSMAGETERAMYAGLAVSIASVSENMGRNPTTSPGGSLPAVRRQPGKRRPDRHRASRDIAFDPGSDGSPGSSDFYVISGAIRLFSTFEAVTSVALLDTGGEVA